VSVETGLAPSPARQDLRRRLVTALVLGPLFLLAVAVGGLVFLGAILLIVGVAAWEFFRLAARKSARPRTAAGVGFALAFPALLYWAPGDPLALVALVTAGVIGIALVQLLDPDSDEALAGVSTTLYGGAYTGLLLGHFVLIREVPLAIAGMPYLTGAALVAVPVFLTWVNDSAAYVIGHRWGRRKLIPRVSPGKTLEGAVGALLVTVAVAVPTLLLVDRWVALFDLADGLAVGALIGLAAPLGDLVESAFKRDAGVKDASDLIPGHGGVLDRFDSLMTVAPAFWYYLHLAVL
jgi:phosphatidate cytidylyltransferase